MEATKIITTAKGTSGRYWDRSTTYFPSSFPPLALSGALRPDNARRVSEVIDAFRLSRRGAHYDGIVTGGTFLGLIYAAIGALIARRRPAHVMIDCLWYRESAPAKRALRRALTRLAARSVYRFIVWASHEVDDYAREFGISKNKFVYVPFHYTLDTFDDSITDEGYLFSGGDGDRDYTTLIEAVSGLDIPVIIATRRLEALKEMKIPAHVKLYSPDPVEFRSLMARARLTAVAMAGGLLHSGGQQTCLNAMAMGKPTIAVGKRWASDLIDDGCTGLIVEYGDADGLRQAIQWVMKEPEKAALMAKQGRKQALTFTTERCMREVYRIVCEGSHQAATSGG